MKTKQSIWYIIINGKSNFTAPTNEAQFWAELDYIVVNSNNLACDLIHKRG